LLFKDETNKSFLLPEVPRADYLLKYSGEKSLLKNYEGNFKLISGLVSLQKIPSKKLKSKNNLIVD
jgi:hypothetical protein